MFVITVENALNNNLGKFLNCQFSIKPVIFTSSFSKIYINVTWRKRLYMPVKKSKLAFNNAFPIRSVRGGIFNLDLQKN